MTFPVCDDCGRNVTVHLDGDVGRLQHDCLDHTLHLTGPLAVLLWRWRSTYARDDRFPRQGGTQDARTKEADVAP